MEEMTDNAEEWSDGAAYMAHLSRRDADYWDEED